MSPTLARISRVAGASVLLTASLAVLGAQAPAPAAAPNLQQSIPFDATVRTGTLPNGVTYFVRQNARPEKRLALRLAVRAGSLFEADDQQGLAHLIEHMAFNGSAHFAPGELVSYFESVGARLGPHVNAYTSFDETVYMLDLPTDSKDVVTKGLTAMADFGGGLTLDPGQIDKERGVVIEEWRGRLGASSRVRDRQIPVLYDKSRYAERLPIGKPEILRSAPAARLRAFYDTWYRPELLAIIAVGDVPVQELEAGIRSAFGPLAARAPLAQPPDDTVPLGRETRINITSDAEITSSSLQFLRRRPKDGTRLVGDYRRTLVEGLFTHMLNDRFSEIARRPDAKFLSAGAGGDSLSPTVNAFGMSARVADGGLAAGLGALQVEARRVDLHGFTATELERAKRWMQSFYERAYNERDKSESASFANEYLNYFLNAEPSPGIQYEFQLVQQLLPAITLDDVAQLARAQLNGDDQVVLAVMPKKDGLAAPSEADLTAAMAEGEGAALAPWNDGPASQTLLETLPEPGRVASRREIPEIGVTVVTFANGVDAWLKPTDFKNDQVLFTMYSLGGESLASCEESLQARMATRYVNLSGLRDIKAIDLDKMLSGKLASASPFIALSTHGIQGSAAPSELETALQLAFLTFTAPGDDPDALALMKRQLEASVANRGRSPGQVFGEKIAEVNTSGHCTSKPFTAEQIPLIDRAKMMAFYKQRFSNAADVTLFMVGSFKTDSTIPLLARYVGSLPTTGRRSAAFRDIGVRFPTAVQRAKVQKGTEPRSQTLLSFFADPSFEPIEQERLIAATTILETVLRDSLREDLGQTYTVSVGLDQSPPQRGDGSIGISFGASPDNIDLMTERVLQEVRKLQANGPSASHVANAKEGAKRDYETALKQNNYWLRRLQTVHLLGGDPRDIVTRFQRIDSLTPAVVQQTFRQYFPMDRYTVVTLMPEGSGL